MNKYVVMLVLTVLGGGVGYYLGSGNVRVETQIVKEEGTVKIKEVEKIVTITKIVRPDGTVEEVRKEEDKVTDRKEKNSSTVVAEVKEPALHEYSLGVHFHSQYQDLPNIYNDLQDKDNYTVQIGRRLIGPVWGEIGFGIQQYSVGVKWQF